MENTCGRVVRLSKGKTNVEFFTLVINNTVETKWMQNAKSDSKIEIIDVPNLMKVLKGEPYELYNRKLNNYTFRFWSVAKGNSNDTKAISV